MDMTDNVENLILEHLRGLRAGQDRLESEMREVAARLTSLEASTAAGRRDSAHNYEEIIRQQSSIDQIKARIDRIERRLEIAG
jgi:septal ring factor EnvC (AmiA/AmiB activator)